jgi:hypothetical protein
MKILLLGLALFCGVQAEAQSGSAKGSAPWSFVGRKAEVKRQARWSLDEWLATREKYRWQDMWLALNSPSPFEFFLMGSANLIPITRNAKTDLRYGAGAYVSIFGLEFEHDHVFNPEDHARFHLRLFGYNVQNTNLTFQGGVRFQTTTSSYRQWYAGISTSIYLHKYFGIYGLYRYYMSSVSVSPNGVMNGRRWEAGPFIDFGPLRVFGYYTNEQDQNEVGTYRETAAGWSTGAQLFF